MAKKKGKLTLDKMLPRARKATKGRAGGKKTAKKGKGTAGAG